MRRARVDMPVGEPEVPLAIVVKVGKAAGPPEVPPGSRQNAGRQGDLIEEAGFELPEQGEIIVEKCGRQKAKPTLVIEVADSHSHVRLRLPPGVDGNSALQRALLERAVSLIEEQEIRVGVVRHEQVDLAILIEVVKHGSETMRKSSLAEAGPIRDIREGAVAVVVIQHTMAPFHADWAAKCGHSLVRTIRRGFIERNRVNIYVAGHVQIQIAVTVEIAKRATRMPFH